MSGPPPRVRVIQTELDRFERPRYLEIGVFDGAAFLNVSAASKVAVDPRIRVGALRRLVQRLRSGASFRQMTSDAYFAALDGSVRFDVVFVDGLHLCEQALRDTENALAHLSEDGVVLVHDCNPPTAAVATRAPEEAVAGGHRAWCGDVWKAVVYMRATRPDLRVEVLNTDYGIAVVRRGKSSPIGLDAAAVAGLTYADLDADRERLLGLRPAEG